MMNQTKFITKEKYDSDPIYEDRINDYLKFKMVMRQVPHPSGVSQALIIGREERALRKKYDLFREQAEYAMWEKYHQEITILKQTKEV